MLSYLSKKKAINPFASRKGVDSFFSLSVSRAVKMQPAAHSAGAASLLALKQRISRFGGNIRAVMHALELND